MSPHERETGRVEPLCGRVQSAVKSPADASNFIAAFA
jgi:hypothetical protein